MRASGRVIVAETTTDCILRCWIHVVAGLQARRQGSARRSQRGRRMGLMTGHDGALPNPRGVKLTYDDFVLFPDDGLRHELIDGEHYVTPSPNDKHQTILANLLLLIGVWVRAHATGKVWIAPFDVVLSRSDVVEPDLLYMSNQRKAEVLTEANVQGPPELVVEVGSPSTRRR